MAGLSKLTPTTRRTHQMWAFFQNEHGWFPGHDVASHSVMHDVDILCLVAMFFGGLFGGGEGKC